MTCGRCHRELERKDRVVANVKQTFVFKPSDVPDTVHPAQASPGELLESRKDFTKTEMATVYMDYGDAPAPDGAFNIRHAACDVPATGSNPFVKHGIRYSRGQFKRGAA